MYFVVAVAEPVSVIEPAPVAGVLPGVDARAEPVKVIAPEPVAT